MKDFNEHLGMEIPTNIDSFTIWKINIDEENILKLSTFLQKEIEKTDSPILQEKLIALKELI